MLKLELVLGELAVAMHRRLMMEAGMKAQQVASLWRCQQRLGEFRTTVSQGNLVAGSSVVSGGAYRKVALS
jgi:ATP/maltotriose-dependent transcriptional regulator MalT